jgi:hypothetical protein
MKPPGAYRIASRNRSFEAVLEPSVRSARRLERILGSLRSQIREGGRERVRLRRVFKDPREIFRLEVEFPELACQRITLLDREALEQLLSAEDVLAVVGRSAVAG